MKLLNKIFTGIICGALLTNGVMAADDCSNIAYKQSHPERCKYNASSSNTTTYLAVGAGVAAAGAALAALAGGGGGSSSGGVSSYNTNTQYYASTITPTTLKRTSVGGDVNIAQLESAILSGYYNRNATPYDEIQLAYSIARGYDGAGTTIAVFDTAMGKVAQHAEYVIDSAASVAPGATIEHYAIAKNTNDFLSYYEIGDIIANATGANVYNNSWNQAISSSIPVIHNEHDFYYNFKEEDREGVAHLVDSVKYIAETQDAIFVWAAGNDSYGQSIKYESGVLSAMPIIAPELNGHFVNVVAWDSETSALADYSNICGATKNFCITAPGTIKMQNNREKSGTSFAAPVVSAAIAVIRQAWNYIDSETVVQILFDTATDLGDAGVDEIYGHGMLDMEAATRPVGTQTIMISDTVSQPLQVARASAQIAQSIKSANPTMASFDKYGREFETSIADNISIQNRGLGFERLRGDDARMKINMGDIEFGFYRNDMLSGTGFLQTDGDTTTTYIATNKSYNFGNFELFGRTQMGVARPRASEESIISEFSNIYTASAYVGVRGDKWSLSVGVPDTIVDGSMNLHLATGRDSMGAFMYRDYNIDMTGKPAVEYIANYKFLTAGFVDNPYGNNEFYIFAKTKFAF